MGNAEDSLIRVTRLLEIMSEEIESIEIKKSWLGKDHDNKEDLNELVFTLRDLTKQIDQHLDELEG